MSDYAGVTNQLGNAVGLPFSSFSTDEPGMIDLAFAADDLTRMNDMFWLDGIRRDSANWNDGDGAVRWSNGFNVYVRPFRGHVNGTIVFAPQTALSIEQAALSERVDSIIIRRDYTLRTVNVMVLKGESGSTEPPILTYNSFGVAEYALAHIRVTNAIQSLSQADIVDVRTQLVANLGISPWFRGKIELLSVRPENLSLHAPGWYFCNGDQYTLSSTIGGALFNLPANFKTDWGITVSGSIISLPNLFYSDGRGYFLRGVNGTARQVGSVETDAQQNITGVCIGLVGSLTQINGSLQTIKYTDFNIATQAGNAHGYSELSIDTSRQVRTSTESRSLNRGMTPAIFLGV